MEADPIGSFTAMPPRSARDFFGLVAAQLNGCHGESEASCLAFLEEQKQAFESVPTIWSHGDDSETAFAFLRRIFMDPAFSRFAFWYAASYLAWVAFFTLIGSIGFGIDYRASISRKQFWREVRLSAEGVLGYTITLYLGLQFLPQWTTDISAPFALIILQLWGVLQFFNFFFYASHRLWHSNRTLYRWIHADHHESVVVCPLTSLSNSWLESLWVGMGTLILPMLGFNNVMIWYASIAIVVFLAVQGHSRIPFTLEHAAHHATLSRNLAFYFPLSGVLLPYDSWCKTWTFAKALKKCQALYSHELTLYNWDENEASISKSTCLS